ncbi:MAG: branched-chain amino acid ABC transporter permease [Microbacterium sp.]|uniref:branched-chain amino acid ABC transporter permease n=1 Tax=Microbacterium sp. TaxID=51671 RepID=UPI001AC8E930|nr:branched-chain amino acid ABC transporter permease [Microbacterium sp.]MBN9154795.1 branched-chain amino acid ABC transporter permease [Microbacterium sp.]
MTTLIQVIVSGILVGGLYGIISSGLSLSFGISKIANFAHADFVTIGMYSTFLMVGLFSSWGLLLAPVIAAVVGLIGVLVYVVLLRRSHLRATNDDEAHLPQVVITAGLGILIQSVLLTIFGSNDRSISTVLDGSLRVGGIAISKAQLVAFAVSAVAFIALELVVTRTEFGRALRAIVDDGEQAAAVGVNRTVMVASSMGIGVGLAGLAGALLATYQTVTPTSGFGYLAMAFVVIILGGLGSIRGAFIAGIVVGIVQQATGTYIALDLQNVAIWVLFLVVLLVRPNGLFGKGVTL